MRPDRFSFDVELSEWLFTVALGLSLGVALAGAWLLVRRRSGQGRAVISVLVPAGLLLFFFAGLSATDTWPLEWVDLRLKVYASTVALVVVMVAAFATGVAGALLAAVAAWRMGGAGPWRDLLRGVGLITLTAAVIIALLGSVDEAEAPRHPAGTITNATVGATALATGLDLPTGLAIGPGGEIFFTELESGRLGVLRPSSTGGPLEPVTLTILPRPEQGQVFHLALHPEWPRQPYVYVTAEYQAGSKTAMRVLRVQTDGQQTARVETVVEGLPLAQRVQSNHFGSALAFCGGYLFVSTGDTDTILEPSEPQPQLSALAQQPLRPEGKVLRYRLEGTGLSPAGVIAQDPPVYAMGFRNPFGMTCDPDTGYPVVGENGDRGNDQVRIVAPGSNHEWPFSQERRRVTPPFFTSRKAHLAPTGAAIRQRDGEKRVVLGAYQSEAVYELTVGPDWQMTGKPRLLQELPAGPLSLAIDARGCVYVADSSTIWRLEEPGCSR